METIKRKTSTFLLLHFLTSALSHQIQPALISIAAVTCTMRTKTRNCGPISCQKAASGQMFSSCGQVAEGRSVLHFTTSCPCTDSTEVVMQEENSLEPLLHPKPLMKICGGLTFSSTPRSSPLRRSDKQAQSVRTRATSALDGMAPLLCPPSPSSTRDSFHFRPWWRGGLWNNSAAIEHLQNALFADFFHDLQ